MAISRGTIPALYTGAALGTKLSQQIGSNEAEGGDIGQQVRANLLAAGVASGKVNPSSLSSADAGLLGLAIGGVKPHTGSGGIIGDLEKVVTVPFNVAKNTAGELASAVEGFPQGLLDLGEAAYNTLNPVGNLINHAIGLPGAPTPKGPNLADVGKSIVKGTVQDFTHFDPMHPLYPLLDIAGLASGGATLAARSGGALSRLAAGGRAAEAGEAAGLTARTLGRTQLFQQLGKAGQKVSKIASIERAPLTLYPSEAAQGVEFPQVQRFHSVSPFKNFFVERPIDKFFGSRIAKSQIPFFSEGTTFDRLRSNYVVRHDANLLRGRASSGSIQRTILATHEFNESIRALIKESPNQTVAGEKFNALVLRRVLGADWSDKDKALEKLDAYRENILGGKVENGAPSTVEGDQIRDFYKELTNTDEYRRHFSQPTVAMGRVAEAWDRSIFESIKELNLDPNEVLARTLGPAAAALGKSPDEILKELPREIADPQKFAMQASDVEKELREAKGDEIPAEHQHMMALAYALPGDSMRAKINIVKDAIESLKEDMSGEHTRAELLNNAEATGYLPGNTLSQKIATALHDRLGVDTDIAERYAYGSLTNYFPSASAADSLKIRPKGTALGRRMRALKLLPGTADKDVGLDRELRQFRRVNLSRTISAASLGVEPFASFLKDVDISPFLSGTDRRDPSVLIRHIGQRERVLTHRILTEPMVNRLALKNGENGEVMRFKDENDLIDHIGSTNAAKNWRLLPPNAIRTLVSSEDSAALDMAHALDGGLSEEEIDKIIDDTAHSTVRDLSDQAVNERGYIAVPSSYVENLIKHAKILDSGNRVGHAWQAFINRWRSAVLAYMPSWVWRTSVGHGMVMFIGGVWNPKYYHQATAYFKDGYKIPGTSVHLSRGLNREEPLGISQGSPHADFGVIGQHAALKMNKLAQISTSMVHQVNSFQRRAGFLAMLDKSVKQRFAELGETFKVPHGFWDARNIADVIENHPDLVHHALNELDKVSYTFGQMSPWERRLAKNFLPFWGWYKFISKFVWSLPITYPGRALLIARIGQVGSSDQDAVGPFPDWLKSSVMFNTHNLAAVHYISTLGINPLGDVLNPAGGFQGIVRLGQLSPVIQAGLEGAGYNTLTGGLEDIDPSSGIIYKNGKYVNLNTGKEYDSLDQADPGSGVARAIGGLLRSFPQVRITELAATGGKAVYPESIPIIQEHPIAGATPKDVSPLAILGQYGGIKPAAYNVQSYQKYLHQDLSEALSAFRRAIAKEKIASATP